MLYSLKAKVRVLLMNKSRNEVLQGPTLYAVHAMTL